MFDIVRLGGLDMRDDVHAEAFFVEAYRGRPVVAFDRPVGKAMRQVASAGELFFGKLGFPRIGDLVRQARSVAVLIGLDLPVIAAGLDEKDRIRTGALVAHDDFLQSEPVFVRHQIIVGAVDLLIIFYAHPIVIAKRFVRSIVQITRQKDPIVLDKTYRANLQQYEAIQGLPFPWQEGIESMINGFHARFTPALVKNRDARPYLDPSFVQRAVDRLGLVKK